LSLGEGVPQFTRGGSRRLKHCQEHQPDGEAAGKRTPAHPAASRFPCKSVESRANPKQARRPPASLTQLAPPPHIPTAARAPLTTASLLIKTVPLRCAVCVSPVLPAGLRPEGRARAEYHVETSPNCSQFRATVVGAAKASDGRTTPLPTTGSTARASSAPGRPGSEERSPCVRSWGCPGEDADAVGGVAGFRAPGSPGTADAPAGEPSWRPCSALGGVWRSLSQAPRGARVGCPRGFVKRKRETGKSGCPKDPLLNGDRLFHQGCGASLGSLGERLEQGLLLPGGLGAHSHLS